MPVGEGPLQRRRSAVGQDASISQVPPPTSAPVQSVVKVKAFHLEGAGEGGGAAVSAETVKKTAKCDRLLAVPK